MTRRFVAALLAAFALSTASGLAQTTIEATPVPKPAKPDFSSMQFLVGTWSCSTKSSRRPAAFTSTVTWAMDPAGYWLVGRSARASMAWFPFAVKAEDRITYDSDAKRWVYAVAGEFGGYDLSTSTGWNENTITWHSLAFVPSADVLAQSDLTQTKVSNTRLDMTSSFRSAKNPKVTVATTCTKQS